ncbi:MAG: DNA cytosine methyltransferase, partial [Paraclostridium sp.]
MKALSLFSGMGIGEMYLKDIDINVVVANECIKEKAQVYKYFHPETNMIYGDIREYVIKSEIIKKAKDNNVEMLLIRFTKEVIYFGRANKVNSYEINKESGNEIKKMCIDSIIDIIDALDLKYILIECNKHELQLRSDYKRDCITLLDRVKDKYNNIYNIDCEIINYADLGVPQRREKGVIRLWKEELTWNDIEKLGEHITVKEAIGNLPSIELGEYSDIKNHYLMNRGNKQIEWMKYTSTGKLAMDNEKKYHCKEDGTKIKKYINRYHSIDWNKVAPPICRYNWVISGFNTVHPGKQNDDGTWNDARVLTNRELLILSSVDGDLDIPHRLITSKRFRDYLAAEIPPIGLKNLLRGIEISSKNSTISTGKGNFFCEARDGSVVKVE